VQVEDLHPRDPTTFPLFPDFASEAGQRPGLR
jgi:hypothetical protein